MGKRGMWRGRRGKRENENVLEAGYPQSVVCVLPVSSTRADRQENAGRSRLRLCRWELKSLIESSHSPKPRRHCSLWSTRPVQKTNFSSANNDLQDKETERQREGTGVSANHEVLFIQPCRHAACPESKLLLRRNGEREAEGQNQARKNKSETKRRVTKQITVSVSENMV